MEASIIVATAVAGLSLGGIALLAVIRSTFRGTGPGKHGSKRNARGLSRSSDALVTPGRAISPCGKIWRSIQSQLHQTALLLGDPRYRDSLNVVASYSRRCIASISTHMQEGHIDPHRNIRLSQNDAPAPIIDRPLRIGVLPTAADPLHWGHILCGLSGLARMKLDKVVFIVAGSDPRKPWLSAADGRHRLARDVIEVFEPLFAYSAIALGTDLDGERNVGRLLDLNPNQQLHAFYMAGADHYRRLDAYHGPDTIQKLEDEVKARKGNHRSNHTLSALFLDRNDQMARKDETVETFLEVHVLPPVPLSFSSTAIRTALSNGDHRGALAALPFSAYEGIQRIGLYPLHTGLAS